MVLFMERKFMYNINSYGSYGDVSACVYAVNMSSAIVQRLNYPCTPEHMLHRCGVYCINLQQVSFLACKLIDSKET